jgi:hypothetical protein
MDEVHPDMTNFDGIFKGCTKVKNDIPLPLNTTSAIEAFSGCSSMTHVHDNWNKSYPVDEIDAGWKVGSLLYNNANGFGTEQPTWPGCRTSDYIELSSDIVLKNHSISSTAKPNVRILAYDENKNAIGGFDIASEFWYLIPGSISNYAWAGGQLRIPFDEEGEVKYVRITMEKEANTINDIKNNTIVGIPLNSLNCYTGCSNIRYINGIEQTYNEYTKPIDGIPKNWGGFGYSPETTAIFAVETDTDGYTFMSSLYEENDYRLTMYPGAFVDWGDGTTECVGKTYRTTPKHTYEKAGRYIVKGNLTVTRPGYGGHGPAANCVTEVYQYPTNKTISGGDPTVMMFYNFIKLRTAIVPNRIFANAPQAFRECQSLEYVDLTGSVLSGSLNSTFQNCKKLHTIKGLTSDSFKNVKGMAYFFANCNNISNIEFFRNVDFSACTDLSSIMQNAYLVKDITPILDNPTVMNVKRWCNAFENVPAEGDVLDFSFMDRNAEYNLQYTFRGSKYKKVTGMSGLKLTGINIATFQDMPLVEEIDLTDLDMSNVTALGTAWSSFVYNCPKLRVLKMDGVKVTDTLNGGNWSYFAMGCPKIETLSFKGAELYIKNAYRMFETNDTATTLDASDLDLKDLSNATGYAAPFRLWTKLVDFYPPKNIKVNYEPVGGNTVLSAESLIRIIDNLVDVGETRTLTIGATLLAKLTPEQIAVANDKGWTIN